MNGSQEGDNMAFFSIQSGCCTLVSMGSGENKTHTHTHTLSPADVATALISSSGSRLRRADLVLGPALREPTFSPPTTILVLEEGALVIT